MCKYFLEMFFFAFTGSVLSGCAASTPPIVFEPTASDSVYSFYQNGYALGTIGNDSCRVVAQLEESHVAGDGYMRLWLLYHNSSNSPYFLDPMEVARITAVQNVDTVELKEGTYRQLQIPHTYAFEATAPYKILGSIDNQKTVTMIMQAISGTVEAVGQKPTTVTNTQTGEQWQVSDTKEKREKVINETSASIAATSMIYDLYKQSVVAGILRRNTVFPKQSVTGYIYFKLPEVTRYSGNDSYTETDLDPRNCVIHLEVFTQNGEFNLDFKPVVGE